MNITKCQIIKLPKALRKQWTITYCLSMKKNSETYLLKGLNDNKETCILKTYHHNCFSKKKYKKVSHFSDTYLLLPQKHYYEYGIHFILYPKFISLKDILTQNGLSICELLSLGIDLTFAIETLLKHHFFEADISPNNIYQNEKGFFCLGDINLNTGYTIGTPGYLAPEYSSTKIVFSIQFEKAMQYSICKLLDSIYQLDSSIQTDSVTDLLDRGMQSHPDFRFSSLEKMRKELENQRNILESHNQYPLFSIKESNHALFHIKTLPNISKKNLFLFPFLWAALILAGCIFLVTLYHYLHPDDITSSQKGIYQSKISDSNIQSDTSNAISNTPIPSQISQDDSEIVRELNIQKMGLSSFSSVPSYADYPDKITCLYAGENRFKDTSSLHRFSNIKELYLNNNYIQKLSDISTIKNLEILVLSYNQLTYLPDLSEIKSLNHLDISSNPDFKDVDSLKNLNKLTTLNIAGTGITKKQYQLLCKKLSHCHIIY